MKKYCAYCGKKLGIFGVRHFDFDYKDYCQKCFENYRFVSDYSSFKSYNTDPFEVNSSSQENALTDDEIMHATRTIMTAFPINGSGI